ncbi:MAG: glycosyltransferase family A protein [Candidatus Omnitrophota bacterium]
MGLTASVVIATYNRASFLSRAVRSALGQTFKDIEVIVVDDASTDNTPQVIADLKDPRLIYLRHEKNKGAGGARNTGIRASRGEFIPFLDSDDEWMPDKLEKQISLFKRSSEEVGLVYCGHTSVIDKTKEVKTERMPTVRGHVAEAALRYCVTGGGSTYIIRKECFEKIGFFDEELPSLEDWELLMRLSQSYAFEFVPEILTKRYMHREQLTAKLSEKIEAREKILRKHFTELSKYPYIHADHLNRLGVLVALGGELKGARAYFLKSIKTRPLQGLAYFHIFPLSLFPAIYKRSLEKEVKQNSWDGIPIYW